MHANRYTRKCSHRLLPLWWLAAMMSMSARAAEVQIPITLDHEFLTQLITHTVYRDANDTMRAWDDGSGCNHLTLSEPIVDVRGTHLRLRTTGDGYTGTPLQDQCFLAFQWDGVLEVLLTPVLERDAAQIRFNVAESTLYDRDRQRSLTHTLLWKWTTGYVHPRLETIRIDLRHAIDELRGILEVFVTTDDLRQLQAILTSLTIAELHVEANGVGAVVSFTIPDGVAESVPLPSAEAPLNASEMAEWDATWQGWDAFVTFVIKQAATAAQRPELRDNLLDVLLQSRYDLSRMLTTTTAGGRDPLRELFVDTWQQLAPLLRQLSGELPGEAALQFLTFIAAADALRAVDQLGAAVGIEISTDGLRRMARIVAPGTADPLRYDINIDIELRELFKFGAPLPRPQDQPDVSSNLIGTAWAAAVDPDQQLNGWAPNREDVHIYAPLARDLLRRSAAQTLGKRPLDGAYRDLFEPLVFATAWQETCWRQYVRKAGKIVPIRSQAGAVGIMQIVPRVWRGFYDPGELERDIVYNASAGSEILAHYLIDYAIKRGEHVATGDVRNLARATYAAYNGGPRHLRRYREAGTKASLREIDDAFWQKYQTVSDGDELAVIQCYGGTT